jgi:diaminohydroxyphosphoribosylaminopyrimidine deaminase / 5-amino-6-(5-phosphoribosylamino)uracil reductase
MHDDDRTMDRALDLAARGYGQTSPNPLVGAVVVRAGRVVGEGVHLRAGQAHAEPQALAAALDAGSADAADDLALYVNLEPCCHQGLTPPCVDAILAARVTRVVASMLDPDPRVSGRGVERLRRSGVRVDLGCRRQEAEELNHVFIARQRRRRPFVALKVALSADDCIAAADGSRVRITGEAAQRHAHRVRAGHDAILVGVQTLAVDRPRLDRRLYDGPGGTPRRLVLDPRLRARPEWLWADRPSVLFCSRRRLEASPVQARDLGARAELVGLPERDDGLDLEALVGSLEGLGIWSVLVEGGGRTQRGFLAAGLWDRMLFYRNPELRLRGLRWEAGPAWEREREHGVVRERTALDGDRLEVVAHRDSLAAGDTPRA